MPKQIPISDALFQRLQKHAVPFEDTPATVIERMVDFYEEHNIPQGKSAKPATGSDEPPSVAVREEIRKFDPRRPPDLCHTRVRGEFAGTGYSKWTDLMRIAHIKAYKTAGSFEALREVTRAQIRNGSQNDNGFKPIPEIGLSLQGVDANHAWSHSLRLAQHLNVPLRALVEWQNKDNAAFPGEEGLLAWSPTGAKPPDDGQSEPAEVAGDPWKI